ncbi:MAG: endolytic transglycosylase MltG [Nitrospirae bacterium]|nr:endolytic transglycosylase MltG [Candidatus Troglogloeales bacterium]
MSFIRNGIFLLILAGATHIGIFFLNPDFSGTVQKEVRILEGASFKSVAELLTERQLITNSIYFRLLGQWHGKDQKIKPGLYTFHAAMRPIDILDLLVLGKISQKEITIREGQSSREIAKILYQAGLGYEEDFLIATRDPILLHELGIGAESLEGYLFPDTYFIAEGASSEDIIKQMVNRFKSRFNPLLEKTEVLSELSQREIVILASMIDKETSESSERPIISAVFHNRLRQGMRLQSDPTVIFGLPDFNGNLTRKDLVTPSSYNTYLIPGLPPGPIGNPGEAALSAAMAPADVEYLYFVSKNNGTHYFSKTLEEHNAAVNKYQRNLS